MSPMTPEEFNLISHLVQHLFLQERTPEQIEYDIFAWAKDDKITRLEHTLLCRWHYSNPTAFLVVEHDHGSWRVECVAGTLPAAITFCDENYKDYERHRVSIEEVRLDGKQGIGFGMFQNNVAIYNPSGNKTHG